MARCGSSGMCECIVHGGQGIRVPGNGSIAAPYTVGAYRSTDAGNCARFGSDGGIYVPCSADDESDVCGVSVAGLAANHVVVGRGGAGRLLAPDHALRSFSRAVELNLDAVQAYVRELADGTPVCYPHTSITPHTGITLDPELTNMHIGGYKTMPLRIGFQAMDAAENEQQANRGRRHGYFGFSEPDQVGGTTLAEVLQTVGKRCVLVLEAVNYSPPMLERMLSLIFRYCAQQSVIVASDFPEDLGEFRDAGIPTMVTVRSESEALEKPPQTLLDQGVTWVSLNRQLSDDTILGYTGAGLQSMMYMLNRHAEWDRVENLGVRAVLSDDPMYMSNDPDRYRTASLDTPLVNDYVLPGMLTFWTDPRPGEYMNGEVYWPPNARPYVFPRTAPHIDASWVYLQRKGPHDSGDASGTPYRLGTGMDEVLTGWLNPIPVPDNYVFEWSMSFRDDPGEGNRNAGLLFGMANDLALSEYNDQDSWAYWSASMRWNGELNLTRVVDGTIVDQADTTSDEAVADTWMDFRVTVTPDDVTFERLDGSGGSVTITQPETRGPYTHIYKHELFFTNNTWYPFALGWRNMRVRLPGQETAAQVRRVSAEDPLPAPE